MTDDKEINYFDDEGKEAQIEFFGVMPYEEGLLEKGARWGDSDPKSGSSRRKSPYLESDFNLMYRDKSDRIDTHLPSGSYKPWDIIIDYKSKAAYGFSPDEYQKSIEQGEIKEIRIRCKSCGKEVTGNPFTGLTVCPDCGSKLHILEDNVENLFEASTLSKPSVQYPEGKRVFMTGALNIPNWFIESLGIPEFKYVFIDRHGGYPALAVLAIIMLTGFYFLRLYDGTPWVTAIILLLTLAFIIGISIINRDLGVWKIRVNDSGVRFYRLITSRLLRFERIVYLGLSRELSKRGALKKVNKWILILIAPIAAVFYVLTVGTINLYDMFHDRYGSAKSNRDYVYRIKISTRQLTVSFLVDPVIHPEISRVLGILIFMAVRRSAKIVIEPDFMLAAQRLTRI